MRIARAFVCLVAPALLLGGCSSTYRSPTTEAFNEYQRSQVAQIDAQTTTLAAGNAQNLPTRGRYASLGAGDRLGRQIYINDVVLAAATRSRQLELAMPAAAQPVLVDVPVSDD